MTFLAKPITYTREQLAAHVGSIRLTSWIPKFITLHNSGVPSLKQYLADSTAVQAEWPYNLDNYYEGMRWHSGPHWMNIPTGVINLCDPTQDGVSVSCWNHLTWGIEMCGNFEVGGDDPTTGPGLAVVDNAIELMALLHNRFSFLGDPGDYAVGVHGLHFHKECISDHHACPGSLVNKENIVQRLRTRIAELKVAQPIQTASPLILSVWPSATSPYGETFFANAKLIYTTWKSFGVSNEIACGMLAQAEAESSCNPKAIGDHDTAFGLHQWHSARVAAIKAGCGIDIAILPDIVTQCKAAWWELNNPAKGTLELLLKATTAAQAGQIACADYERPASPAETPLRGEMAERWAVWISTQEI